ncbi:MAG: hypothetical protein LBE31_06810 [Deltaproteobacteria bacterium]|jgi:hypothetical protein|nr:hypothetical protein [Deltaproteobacteria bacterium]
MTGQIEKFLGQGAVRALYGPMNLFIIAENKSGPDDSLALEAGKFSFSLLERVSCAPKIFKRNPMGLMDLTPQYDEPLLNDMVEAVLATKVPDLWPMAAVAGTVAQAVVKFMASFPETQKAIVENGGDVAVFLAPQKKASIGIRLGLDRTTLSHKIELTGDINPFYGVCSSGLGGRSLTTGVADTAMCLAYSCSIADAAATAVANACRTENLPVIRKPAQFIRPQTDVPYLLVTYSLKRALTLDEAARAIDNAISLATELIERKVILGALISAGGLYNLVGFSSVSPPVKLA